MDNVSRASIIFLIGLYRLVQLVVELLVLEGELGLSASMVDFIGVVVGLP